MRDSRVMLADLELMEHHVKVLFKHDNENRMTAVNEPPYDDAPRIFIGGTKQGYIVRYSNTLKVSLVEKLETYKGTNPGDHLVDVINVLVTDRPINNLWIGPAYVFPNAKSRSCPKAIQVTHENKELLKDHFRFTFEDFEYKQPCFVIMDEGIPVSICCSARQTSKADEASVFTHENYRGRGYGIEVSNAWAAEVQKQGRIALYSTSWDNFASQSVAKKLKLIQYGTDIHMS
ncbi:GNAT family N-acetyltransferase [Paenibacillus sp. Y412MC10]|uniref:GNAT family N-acetyltransferase n=1 Tax=Geobacillus sp. (strain Y412MC10) TaxID=481743 RepID=UPI0021B426B5|nr:GNAT family N-acetyltransferase [Paenibacillus sp. Y412MC10]